jgi:hypothetical protein
MQRDHLEGLGLNKKNDDFCLYKQQASQGGTCFVHRLTKLELASIKKKDRSLEAAMNFQAEGLSILPKRCVRLF